MTELVSCELAVSFIYLFVSIEPILNNKTVYIFATAHAVFRLKERLELELYAIVSAFFIYICAVLN